MPSQKPARVVFQPHAYRGMQRGINQIVDAIRPTLGPRPRMVAVASFPDNKPPELLDDGGVIARRIIQLAQPGEDMGAMFLRQMLWRIHEDVGDATATAAVLFQSIYNQGVRYIVSGGDPMRLRHHLEEGMRVVLDPLDAMTIRLQGKESLAEVAESICHDPPMARMLGEIFDIIGEYGRLDIQAAQGRELDREYVEGMYWKGGLLSMHMITDPSRQRAELDDALILISDIEINEPRTLVPVMETVRHANIHSLVIIASALSDSVIGLLMANREALGLQSIAVKTPGLKSDDQAQAMRDLAVLTGGRPLLKAAGDTVGGAKFQDLGRARRVWADGNYFGLVGGKGDPRALRGHIAELRASFKATDDPERRAAIQERLGKLMGGSATLWVGGSTESEISVRKQAAERAASALRGAVREGVLPGGGVALLACRPALRDRLVASRDADERAAYRALVGALEEPTRTILSNAGCDCGRVMAEIELAGEGYGFDVRSGKVVKMSGAGIFDSAAAQKAAVQGAITSAGLALTVEVLVHHREPKRSVRP